MRDITTTLLYNWFEKVWNQSNEDAISEMMSEDAVFDGIPGENGSRGASAFKAFFRDFNSQLSNIHIDVDDVVSQDDMEAARTVIHAVDRKTNTPITVPGLCMIRKEKGQIVEAWNNYDFLAMHLQLGQKLVAV